ncbi:unnamed protein product [Soboliphyme baturini]|uniref:Kinesin motor domain-containing protein n=1 Tax=Soboliphyme baturini TaxID=241478 RepID=A0A183J7Q7_9BILA|nr:unnamed protein product [Soboliphyme baturini]
MKMTAEVIALTPVSQLPENHVIAIERLTVDEKQQLSDVVYEGAGPHAGLLVRKRNPFVHQEEITAADVEVAFKVDLFDSKDGNHQQVNVFNNRFILTFDIFHNFPLNNCFHYYSG